MGSYFEVPILPVPLPVRKVPVADVQIPADLKIEVKSQNSELASASGKVGGIPCIQAQVLTSLMGELYL
jgi:hypothetical protein